MGGEGLISSLARALPLVLLALLDGLMLRQGAVALGLLLYGAGRWFFPGRQGRRTAVLSLGGAVFAGIAIAVHFELLERRAGQTVAAARTFQAEQGRYPATLQELVPRYLTELPQKIYYRRGEAGHRVEYYPYSPLFLNVRFYRLEQGVWETLVD